MSASVLAAQLYTVRDFTQTRDGLARSLEKVAAIGYRAVQVSAIGDIPDAEVARLAADNGLTICNTHISYDRLCHALDSVIAQHKLWNCRHVAIGSMPDEFRGSEDGFRRFADIANAIGEKLAAAGLTFSYHNHSFELVKFGDRTGLDILFEETDPRFLQAELDTYWLQHGGADPVVWIERMAGRMPVVHLKDMAMLTPTLNPGSPHEYPPLVGGRPKMREGLSSAPFPTRWGGGLPQQAMAEVGEGNMNFAGILAACKRAGVEWYAVEQDICQRDPFESLAISFRNLRALGLR